MTRIADEGQYVANFYDEHGQYLEALTIDASDDREAVAKVLDSDPIFDEDTAGWTLHDGLREVLPLSNGMEDLPEFGSCFDSQPLTTDQRASIYAAALNVRTRRAMDLSDTDVFRLIDAALFELRR